MKNEISKNQILSGFKTILSIPYCAMQFLLTYHEPEYYTTRTEGWANDIYVIDGIAIVTGYAPFGDEPDRKVTRKYEQKAESIVYNSMASSDAKKKAVEELLREYLQEVIEKEAV